MIYADDNFELIFSLVERQLAAAGLFAAKLWRRNKEILSPYIAHTGYSNDDGHDDHDDDGGGNKFQRTISLMKFGILLSSSLSS